MNPGAASVAIGLLALLWLVLIVLAGVDAFTRYKILDDKPPQAVTVPEHLGDGDRRWWR